MALFYAVKSFHTKQQVDTTVGGLTISGSKEGCSVETTHAKDQMQCGSVSEVELLKQSIIHFLCLHRLIILLNFIDTHLCDIMRQKKQSSSSIMVTLKDLLVPGYF